MERVLTPKSALTKIQAGIILIIVIIAAIVGIYYLTIPSPTPSPTPTITPSPKEKIRIGFTLSKSGFAVAGSTLLHEMPYNLWLEQVNEKGGIFIKELGRRLPVEFVWYDDRSDIGTVIELYTKLMTEDKVDFLLPPWGSGFNLAIAPMVSKYKYPLLGSTCYSMKLLTDRNTEFPYFYSVLQQADRMLSPYMDFLNYLRDELRIQKIAIIYNDQDYGVELASTHKKLLEDAGFDVVIFKQYPVTSLDLSPLLTQVKNADADALFAWSYPDDTALIIKQSMAIGLNPKILGVGIGPGLPPFLQGFGNALDGVITAFAWHESLPFQGAKEYYDAFLKKYGQRPDVLGGSMSYALCQIVEQAIEKAGTLDREKIKAVLDTETFTTIAGNIRFTNGLNLVSPVLLGQIIDAKYEVIWPKEFATAEPLIPKPPWQTE